MIKSFNIHGYECLMDMEDWIKYVFQGLTIKYDQSGYKSLIVTSGPNRGKRVSRLLLGIEDSSVIVDHKDRNTLNDCRDNLRVVNPTESVLNRSAWGASKFRGVYKNGKAWAASIMVEGKKIFLGTFPFEALAYEARKRAEVKYFGRVLE